MRLTYMLHYKWQVLIKKLAGRLHFKLAEAGFQSKYWKINGYAAHGYTKDLNHSRLITFNNTSQYKALYLLYFQL
jgi:hypothetical protein